MLDQIISIQNLYKINTNMILKLLIRVNTQILETIAILKNSIATQ